ncbi:hypothetical protein BVX97_04715 [bacterium E08(2017)]|nr:hypothetical protein BVX97_04715 [bacterium E08(2017)]
MKTVQLQRDSKVIFSNVNIAEKLSERMVGLLAHKELPAEHALWIDPCSSIHTFMMKFSIDVIFLDRDMTVVKICRDVAPGNMVFGGMSARSTVEIASGWLAEDMLKVGQKLTSL